MKLSGRVFRALLRMYPAAFRQQYGEGMAELFMARAERARSRGPGAVVGLWLATVLDTLVAASAEHVEVTGSFLRTAFAPAGVLSDVRGGMKRLARTPGASALTVLLLAVGIAGNVALFAAVDALLVQAPPGIGDPGRVVEVNRSVASFPELSFQEFVGMRDNIVSLESIAVWKAVSMAVVREGAGRQMLGMHVSDEYFAVMGARPPRGRSFTRAETEDGGGQAVVVISDHLWRMDLGAAPDAIGQTLLVNRIAHTIVGIGPADFRGHLGPVRVDVWVPLGTHPNFLRWRDSWSANWMQGVGRLAEGVTIGAAAPEINGVLARIREGRADGATRRTISLERLGSVPAGERDIIGSFLGLLMLLGLLALAVLCANVGGMVLARGMSREREIAVRLALGAGRGRVVRQFLVESGLLALAGGIGGVWLAFAGLELAQTALVARLPLAVSLTLSAGVPAIVFAFAVGLATVVVTGLVPALRLVRDDLVVSLKGDGGGGGSAGTGRLRKLLLGSQMAASTLLLVVAALFMRSLQRAGDIDIGFVAEDVQVRTVNLESEGYVDPEAALTVLRRFQDAVAAIPGVEQTALGTDLPMDGGRSTTSVRPEGVEGDDGLVFIDRASVGPGYFEVLAIPVTAGRGFEDSDVRGGEPVAVVSRVLADLLWPGESPVGKPLDFSIGAARPVRHTVVGVVGDVLNVSATTPMRPMVYSVLGQHLDNGASARNLDKEVYLVVKTVDSGASLTGQIRTALLSVDPRLSEAPVLSLARATALGLLPQRMAGAIAGAFGLLTVLLAGVGLYGTIAFEVGRRTREIGIRMALGADRGGLVGGVLKETVGLAAPGFVIGMLAAYWVGRMAYAFLLGIPAGDPFAFGGVAALLIAVVVIASWMPALKASRIDPADALRHE